MNDLELSRKLALAIGWHPGLIIKAPNEVRCYRGVKQWGWQKFDYRDWNVIGPIATEYNTFPRRQGRSWIAWFNNCSHCTVADTPQAAIALAVIQGAGK